MATPFLTPPAKRPHHHRQALLETRVPLIEHDELGLFLRSGPRRVRPLGATRFKAGQTVGSQHLPGTPLHGVQKTGDPRVAEFEEAWVAAEQPEWPANQREESYAIALAQFYYQRPEFNPSLPTQRLDALRHPRADRYDPPHRARLLSDGLARLRAMRDQAALDDSSAQPASGPRRRQSL